MSRLVVYTAIFGGYDPLRGVVNTDSDVDYVCFSDSEMTSAPGWEVRVLDLQSMSPVEKNRELKFFPHRYLGEYDESVYIDGNIGVRGSVRAFLGEQTSLADIAIPRHPDRTCVFQESIAIRARNLAADQEVDAQIARYKSMGMPSGFGLTENNLIYRRQLKPQVIETMDLWWEEFIQGAPRDQLSLPFVFWKSGTDFSYLDFGPRQSSKFFQVYPHIPKSGLPWVSILARTVVARKHQNRAYGIAALCIEYLVSLRDSG